MKTVPLLYFKSRQSVGNVEGFANCIGDALARAGYRVPHLCLGRADFEDGLKEALEAREVDFIFVIGHFPLNILIQGMRVWNHPRFHDVKFFVYLIDTVVYELQPIVVEAFEVPGNRIVFGLSDVSGQTLFHQFARSHGARTQTLALPTGAPPQHSRQVPWRERPYDIAFCGNVGMELQGLKSGDTIEDIFADFKNGPASFPRLIETVKEIHRAPRGEMIMQLMEGLDLSAGDFANYRWLMLAWTVDSYMKRRRRLDIVERLAQGHRKLHVFGAGWEQVAAANPNIVLHGLTGWASQGEIFGQTKILLHVESNTYGGANDRAFWGPASGAVLLSHRNPIFDMQLVHGDGYLGYEVTGADILHMVDRSDDELEAIAASGALKARAFHTWDRCIRDVIDYLHTLSAKAGPAQEISIAFGGRLTEDILLLDNKGDHVGVFTYLSSTPYTLPDALSALYSLLVAGRFQSAFLVAKVMNGAHHRNPTIDLARGFGGAIFGNGTDEAEATGRLRQWVANLDATSLQQFREAVAAPTFIAAIQDPEIRKDPALTAKIFAIRDIVLPAPLPQPVAEAMRDAPTKPRAKRPQKPTALAP